MPKASAFLLLLILLSACCQKPPVIPAFYYWKTTYRTTPIAQKTVARVGAKKLYLRLCDIGVDAQTGQLSKYIKGYLPPNIGRNYLTLALPKKIPMVTSFNRIVPLSALGCFSYRPQRRNRLY